MVGAARRRLPTPGLLGGKDLLFMVLKCVDLLTPARGAPRRPGPKPSVVLAMLFPVTGNKRRPQLEVDRKGGGEGEIQMCKSPSCGKSATATDSPFWVNHNYTLPIVVAKVVEKQLYGSETDDLYTTTASNASYSGPRWPPLAMGRIGPK